MGAAAGGSNLGTITPGTITVAIEPYMPYTAEQNGKLIGLDSDIFNYIAAQLHQKVNVTVTNFAGMLSGVQTRRVDISIGGIAWSQARASDLQDGRVNALVIDTLLVIYQAKQDAGSGLTSDYLAPPSAAQLQAHSAYSAFEPYMTGFYLPKQETTLENAMNGVIRQMYANGEMAKLLTKWGGAVAGVRRRHAPLRVRRAGRTADRGGTPGTRARPFLPGAGGLPDQGGTSP